MQAGNLKRKKNAERKKEHKMPKKNISDRHYQGERTKEINAQIKSTKQNTG